MVLSASSPTVERVRGGGDGRTPRRDGIVRAHTDGREPGGKNPAGIFCWTGVNPPVSVPTGTSYLDRNFPHLG